MRPDVSLIGDQIAVAVGRAEEAKENEVVIGQVAQRTQF